MARIHRTAAARSDLLAIAKYIAADSPRASERWLDEIERTLSLIADFPEMAESVEHLSPNVRRHCVGNYLIFYKPIVGGIELQRVLHGARRIESLFD